MAFVIFAKKNSKAYHIHSIENLKL